MEEYYRDQAFRLLRKAQMLFEQEYWDADYIKETKELTKTIDHFVSHAKCHSQTELKELIHELWD